MNSRTLPTIAIALLLAAPLAGCIENVQDLKDRLDGTATAVEEAGGSLDGAVDQLEQATTDLANATRDATKVKAPVARVSVFADGGALLFKSSFAATETKIPTLLAGGTTVTLSAADSEVVDARATLKEYAWTITPLKAPASSGAKAPSGGHQHGPVDLPVPDAGHDHGGGAEAKSGPTTLTGVSVQHALPKEGGVFLVTLSISDSLGGLDTAMLVAGVNPAKVVRSVTYTEQVTGANGLPPQTAAKSHKFNVTSSIDEMHAVAEKATFVFSSESPGAVDLALAIMSPSDEEAATAAAGSTTEITGLAAGDWTATVTANTAVAADYELVIDVTYQPHHPDVMEIFGSGGDGHGGHAH